MQLMVNISVGMPFICMSNFRVGAAYVSALCMRKENVQPLSINSSAVLLRPG